LLYTPQQVAILQLPSIGSSHPLQAAPNQSLQDSSFDDIIEAYNREEDSRKKQYDSLKNLLKKYKSEKRVLEQEKKK
jgi:hypothetical protein